MSQPFDFDKALKALQSGQVLTGKDGVLTLLIKRLTEAALSAEFDSYLDSDSGLSGHIRSSNVSPAIGLHHTHSDATFG